MRQVTLDVVRTFAKRLYDIQHAEIPVNPKKMSIDRDYRIITDFVSTEEEFVSHSTPHLIRNNKWWSVGAIEKFRSYSDLKWRERCDMYENGRRAYSIEHEYPVGIIKTMLMNKEFSDPEQIVNFCLRYGRMVILTSDENDMLNKVSKTCNTIDEAYERYSSLDIIVRRFSAQLEKDNLND